MSMIERFAGLAREAERSETPLALQKSTPKDAAQEGVNRVASVIRKAFDAAKLEQTIS